MTKIMTASQEMMTDGQIENVVGKLRDALRKHRSEFPRKAVQDTLGVENLGMECLEPFRTRVEANSNLIIRRFRVDRSLLPQQNLDTTGRKQYKDQDVVDAMPQGEGEEVDFYFFKPRPEAYKNGIMSDEALEKELEFHGLKPDPYAQTQFNADNPGFADEHPNGTHWKGPDGKWCFAAFGQWGDEERYVDVRRYDSGWDDRWWFGGVRKYQNQSLDS